MVEMKSTTTPGVVLNMTMAGGGQMEELAMTTAGSVNETEGWTAKQIEAYYLICVSSLGLFFNVLLFLSILLSKKTRRMTSAFIVHGILLDIAKLYFCIPFALSLLNKSEPPFCEILGAAFVTLVTISAFNQVAMVSTEAYAFRDIFGDDERGTICCILFGVLTIYIASVIIHLGPTVIGGNFVWNEQVGNCLYSKGELKSYVSYCMWVGINTMALILTFYYIVLYYRQILSNRPHRINTLVRQAIVLSKEKVPKQNSIRKMVQESLSRLRVLIAVTACYITCWYPLFFLNISDPDYQKSKLLYAIFALIAYSNSAINPLLFIIFDKNLSIIRKIFCCSKCKSDENDNPVGMTPLMATPGPSFQSQIQMYQRIGCRLCREGHSHPENLCNGGYNRSTSVTRDPSFCEYAELHEYTSVC